MSTAKPRLCYRSPVDPKDASRYAPWLRATRGTSGVYVIRTDRTRQVLYVGESHSKRLYETLTRHFQSWSLAGPGRGRTYPRGAVHVATRTTTSRSAITEQGRLIVKLRPRDNLIGNPAADLPDDFGKDDEF